MPEQLYSVAIGQAAVRREGQEITIVASSYMAAVASKATDILVQRGVDVELIDLRSLKPWDSNLVCASVRGTERLVVVDGAWATGGVAAEIAATVASEAFGQLKAPIVRVALPDVPAPTSGPLEKAYYPNVDQIVAATEKVLLAKQLV